MKRNRRGQLSLTCPTCRQLTPVPANGLGHLPTAFHISQFRQILDEYKVESAGTFYCSEHDMKTVDLYCETCRRLICWKCIKRGGNHHSHDYEEVGDAIKRYDREVTALLLPMERGIAAIMKNLEVQHEELSKQRAVVEADIRANIKQLHDILDLRQTELINKLEQITQGRLEDLAVQKKEVETVRAEMLTMDSTKGSREEVLINKINKLEDKLLPFKLIRQNPVSPLIWNLNHLPMLLYSASTMGM